MKLYIKNMVCIRCKMLVKEEIRKLGRHFVFVNMGVVEVMEDKKSVLIEQIKNLIIDMVHYREDFIKTKFSVFLSEKLNRDYTYLSNLFSEVQGITIEQFIIAHKIERIKELIMYDELNIFQKLPGN